MKSFNKSYPYLAGWANSEGYITIGGDEFYSSWIRVFNQGGLIYEEDSAKTLDEALQQVEEYLKNDLENEWGFSVGIQ